MNDNPGVKRCLLKPRPQGQFAGLEWTNTDEWVSLDGLNGLNA
jgi:hypothetical protein